MVEFTRKGMAKHGPTEDAVVEITAVFRVGGENGGTIAIGL